LILICRALPRGLRPAAGTLLLSALGLTLVGCNNNYTLGVRPSLGIAMNVSVVSASGTSTLAVGQTNVLEATVNNDMTNAGVTWSISPSDGSAGTLANATSTSVEFVAPTTTFPGAVAAQITATSVANPADSGTTAMVTYGTPVIPVQPQFPGNVNVAYAGQVSEIGGVQPVAWTVVSGALPPGLTFNNSAAAVTTITGTPTTPGSYAFSVQATDSQGNKSPPAQLTLTINPQNACLLSGHYTLMFSGFRGGSQATHLASINISPTGAITGEQDYKDGHRTTLNEQLDATSNCTIRNTNSGTITLNAPSGSLAYNFSTTAPDANGVIHSARIQTIGLPNNTGLFQDSGSGELDLTDTTALTGTAPSGNFAFGLLGVDGYAVHYGTIGELTAASGTFTGLVDSNDQAAGAKGPLGNGVSDAAMTGTISASDADGRGTVSIQAGSANTTLVYYIVNANKMLIMNADAPVNSARESGYMTRQTGNVSATSFDANALASPSVLSLWGERGTVDPVGVVSLGELSGAIPGAAGTGTVNLILDTADQATDTAGIKYPSQSYSVASNGRGTLTLTGQGATRSFVFYLDGVSNGYILEPASIAGNTGLLELQTLPASLANGTLPGVFVADTQFPQSAGPVDLQPIVQLSYFTLSSSYLSGSFAIDATTGRGFGTANVTGQPLTADALYVVSPTKVDLMNFATPTGTNGSISWLIQ
jgi:hypothetical protein